MFVTAIIAAGGRGARLGGDRPKQLMAVAGRAMLERSVTAFLTHTAISEVIVALPADVIADAPDYLRSASKPLRIVAGGARRQDSVANAVRAAASDSQLFVIHDAARPFASADLISRTIDAAWETGAALAAIAARDTVKRVDATNAPNAARAGQEYVVRETLPRESIYLAQTPQAFRRDVLNAALAVAARDSLDVTDEATLAERAGYAVRIVDGEVSNIKITMPEDWVIAQAIAEQSSLRNADLGLRIDSQIESPNQSAIRNPQSAMSGRPARTGRAGTGYDLHRLVEGRSLVLGGVTIPSERGALGHSDADVVCHAVTDAILGAACLGDIGRHFPDTDAAWKGASSIDLLKRAVAMLAEQGLQVGNVDVTVVLERPKIKEYIDAMRASVAEAIGIDVSRVSIKGKTNEGVDAVGRGEAIAAHAVALVRAQ